MLSLLNFLQNFLWSINLYYLEDALPSTERDEVTLGTNTPSQLPQTFLFLTREPAVEFTFHERLVCPSGHTNSPRKARRSHEMAAVSDHLTSA